MLGKILQFYLKFFAERYLKRARPKIIAITGSVGKTSTKEAIFAVLNIHFKNEVRKSYGNLNTKNGVALAILGFKKSPEKFYQWFWPVKLAPFRALFGKKIKVLVLEIAADAPGDIKFITRFVRPNVVVYTNIGQAHLEIFRTIEKLIEEKTELVRALENDGVAIFNIDDANLKKIIESGNYQEKTFGLEDPLAEITAKNITTEIINYKPLTKYQIVTPKEKFLAESPTLGRVVNIYPVLAATSVAELFNLKKEEIVEGLKILEPQKHRMQVFEGKDGSVLIDDCYNANPYSMKAALATLKILPSPRKIAVLGDMLELGEIAPKAHELIGEYAKEIADETLAIGELAKNYHADKTFSSKGEAIDYLLSKIKSGDTILIKASRGMRFEQIVEKLKK